MELQIISRKIHEIRGQKVMLDFDLAELYEVETRILNQAVKRNIARFPTDFMFQLTAKEWADIKPGNVVGESERFNSSQNVMSYPKHRGAKYSPFAFTEHGITMLSSILKSKKAVQTNIAIVRAFIALRKFAVSYKELAEKIAELEKKYNKQFSDVFEALNLLLRENQNTVDWENRQLIGYKS